MLTWRAWGHYDGPLGVAIQRLKYGGRPDLAAPLGRLLHRCAPVGEWDGVVPVPLHGTRLAERGYNQASLLALALARDLRRPRRCDLLDRRRPTPAQAKLSATQRQQNVLGAFRCMHPARVRGRRWLLIDDVATTGATLRACAHELGKHGAAQVAALVLAAA